jgi:hypothetical protein
MTATILSPLRGFFPFFLRILGLTPQALDLPPLRGSQSNDNLWPGLDTFISGQ